MAMTETRPEQAAESAATSGDASDAVRPSGGLVGLLGSAEHTVIGRLWIATSVVFLLGAGVVGVLLGVERLDTTTYDVFEAKHFQQALSIHAVAGLFLFAIPLLIGVAPVVVPEQ